MPGVALKKRRVISLIAVSCVLLASTASPNVGANEWLKSKPGVLLKASRISITHPCPPGSKSNSGACPENDNGQVTLTSTANGFHNQPLYVYTVTGGRIVGDGNNVIWDFNEVRPGIYTATVEVRDNKKHRAVSSVSVTVKICMDCLVCDGLCPQLSVVCYDEVKVGTPITCKAVVNPLPDAVKYVWSVYGYSGEDLSGRLSSRDTYVSIPTETLAGQTITVEVQVKGLDPSCNRTASSQTKVKP